ncbi:MAG: 2Fe-2S iron-sulfur cluster-binding protein [Opitutales bacterium]
MNQSPKDDGLISVYIDGREVRCQSGANVIEVAGSVGCDVPHFCYHPKLSVSGNCRMCLVELGLPGRDRATGKPMLNADGSPLIQWFPGPAIGCGTKVSAGMHVRTQSEVVKKCREGVMEFLLINHPLDCPICDQAGECKLQEQATGYGRGYSRFIEQKNVKPKHTVLGPRVTLDDERCILCSRCVRFSKEIAKDDVLGFVDRGSYSTLTCFPGRKLENNYSLNTVDICPVGALTSTDFRFKMRVWFLKQTDGIDPESSVGANTVVWSREGALYRITPRRNDEVNDTWMTDSGRLLYQQVAAPDRLRQVTVGGTASTLDLAMNAAATLLAAGHVAIVGSGRSSVEEQFLTARLAATLKTPAHLVSRVGQGDGILLSADRNPNVRGALVTGLIKTLPEPKLTALAAAIDAGQVKTVVSMGEDLAAAGLTAAQLGKVAVVYCGTHVNPTSQAAKLVLPTLTVFEKAGTLVNQQFRLQKFARAVPPAAGATDDLVVLAKLVAAAGGPKLPADLLGLWAVLAAEIPALATTTYANLPATGLLLDGAPYATLPFVEGETLHFKPAVATAATA